MADTDKTHDQGFEELRKIIKNLSDMEVVLDVAAAFGCPFEGKRRSVSAAVELYRQVYDMGVGTSNLCDTVGQSDPAQATTFMCATKGAFLDTRLELRVHDTREMGIAYFLEEWKAGVDEVQSTLGGLGDCPFAPGASGNTATEDLVLMSEEMGIDTGIPSKDILALAKEERSEIQRSYSGANLLVKDTIYDLTPLPQKS